MENQHDGKEAGKSTAPSKMDERNITIDSIVARFDRGADMRQEDFMYLVNCARHQLTAATVRLERLEAKVELINQRARAFRAIGSAAAGSESAAQRRAWTNLTQDQYDALVRDAMAWRTSADGGRGSPTEEPPDDKPKNDRRRALAGG